MTIHYSGVTREAQDRIAEGVTEMITLHLDGKPLPEDFLVVDASS